MIISKTAKNKWNARNKKRLVSLGYKFTKMNDIVDVKIEHLTKGSNAEITVKCDYCGKEFQDIFEVYNRKKRKTISGKDCCNNVDCVNAKAKEAMEFLEKQNPKYIEEIVEKRKATCIKKYGVDNPSKTDEVKNKIAEVNMRKYGVKAYTQTKEYLEKAKNTSLRKYGATNHMKTTKSRLRFKGKNSPVWKGGVKYHRQERATFEYREWRNKVFGRDLYTCQCCKSRRQKGEKLEIQAHHISNFLTDVENRYNLDNGITLCVDCHNKFHSIYGKRNNNKKQLEEFLCTYGKNVC